MNHPIEDRGLQLDDCAHLVFNWKKCRSRRRHTNVHPQADCLVCGNFLKDQGVNTSVRNEFRWEIWNKTQESILSVVNELAVVCEILMFEVDIREVLRSMHLHSALSGNLAEYVETVGDLVAI